MGLMAAVLVTADTAMATALTQATRRTTSTRRRSFRTERAIAAAGSRIRATTIASHESACTSAIRDNRTGQGCQEMRKSGRAKGLPGQSSPPGFAAVWLAVVLARGDRNEHRPAKRLTLAIFADCM